MTVHDLPAINATLNSLSAVFLTLGFIFIKRGNKIAHRNCMITAFSTSVIFLACYLTYHFYAGRMVFPDNWFKPIYLVILLTLWQARRQNFEAHKKIARWTWPLWMYVSVTGVVVYLLLYQIFPQK